MTDIQMKIADATKLTITRTSSSRNAKPYVSWRKDTIGFSAELLRRIGMPYEKPCSVNVYVNRKYDVVIFEFMLDRSKGALLLSPKNGISGTCINKLLRDSGYPPIPTGRYTPTSMIKDVLDSSRAYVELSIPGVAK